MPAISFLNAGFLWALPAVAIPLLIHFLSRRRMPEVPFPTVQFLRALEPREIRRIRLRELLLLILRTLAVLLLVLAFARPSLEPRGAVIHAAAAVGILLDDSESMGALDEQARPRMEEARARARAIVEAARSGDETTLAVSTSPGAATAARGGDRVRLGRWVDQRAPTALPARMAPALERLRRELGQSRLKARELYVISDFQRTNWDAAAIRELRAAAELGARIVLLPVVETRVANHGFVGADPELRPGPEGRGHELRARIENFADAPTERFAVRARRDETLIGVGDVSLKPDESRWISLSVESRPAREGEGDRVPRVPVVLESDRDALPADDRWYALLGAPARIRVLRIAEGRAGAPAPRYVPLALDPGGDRSSGFEVEDAGPGALLGLSPSRSDVVILEDLASLSAEAAERVRAFHRGGGGVVVLLGPHAEPQYYTSRLLPGLVDLALDGLERAPAGSAFELRARMPGHPIIEGLTVSVGGLLTQARLSQIVRGHTLSPRAQVVVSTSGGLPVVVAAPGVSIFLGSSAEEWSDLAFSGAFVPLTRGLVQFAAHAAGAAEEAQPHVGERPVARLTQPPAGALTVRGPEDYRGQASVEAEGTGFRAVADAPARVPGFYDFSAGDRTVATVAVNVDPVESDLAAASPDSLRAGAPERIALLPGQGALATHLRDTRRGRELSLSLLVLAGALLLGELALASARALKP
jgi:Aerotolerance regulator N-terminal